MKKHVAGWKYRLFGKIVSKLPLVIRIQVIYFFKFGRLPNIDSPQSFNEKLQWRKVFGHHSEFQILADKIKSKELVKSRAPDVKIPKLLWVGRSAADIPFDFLPPDYVVKANHGSNMNLIVRNGRHPSIELLESYFSAWLLHDQGAVLGEIAYSEIVPCFFIEEYLDFGSLVPIDYKFFVYHGHVRYVQVDTGRFDKHYRNMMTRDWYDLRINYNHPQCIPSPRRPKNLDDMIEIAESISNNHDFLRVDLYSNDYDVYFGEVTIYPGAGFERFESYADDLKFGEEWLIRD